MADLSDIVQRIGHELNPANDFERISFQKYSYSGDKTDIDKDKFREENLDKLTHNLVQSFWILKSFIRGAAAGSIAGAITSVITGYNLQDCVSQGARYGYIIDAEVFTIRLVYKSVKVQFGKYEQ
jgi:hypothetical protein